MELVKVRDQFTLELLPTILEIPSTQFHVFTGIAPKDEEKAYYASIESQIEPALKSQEDKASRRILIQNSECISSLHFLVGRKINRLNVYMRSSNVNILPSDLGFLVRQAQKYGVDKVVVHFGSIHIVLEEE